MTRVLKALSWILLAYLVLMGWAGYAQQKYDFSEMQAAHQRIETITTQNSDNINELLRRMDALDRMQLERRLTTLENTESTNFRLLIGIAGAVCLQLVDNIRRLAGVKKRGE